MNTFNCTIVINKFNGAFATVEVYAGTVESKGEKLSEDTITSLAGLKPILLKIHKRLVMEGRLLPNGVIVEKIKQKEKV
jgi:hypothetical protein